MRILPICPLPAHPACPCTHLPVLSVVLSGDSPAVLPMSLTHSCSSATASILLPNLQGEAGREGGSKEVARSSAVQGAVGRGGSGLGLPRWGLLAAVGGRWSLRQVIVGMMVPSFC